MKIFKRITAIALTLCLSLATVGAYAENSAEEAAAGAVSSADTAADTSAFFDKMIGLGLLESADITETEYMLRGDFVRLAMKMANVNVDGITDGSDYFADLESTARYRKYVNAACELGYIGGEGGYFYPNKAVTKAEALKILTEILGYHTLAEQLGGFPGGYFACASDSKMLKDVNIVNDSGLTLNEGLNLLDGFLDAYLPVREYSGTDVSVYIGDETLAEYLNIGEVKGILSEVGATGLYSREPSSVSKVCINGEYMLIKDGLVCDELLGMNCTGYYREDKTTGDVFLCYVEETPKKNNVIEKDGKDIKFKNGEYVYTVNGKEKTADLSRTYTLIYNGRFTAADDALMNTDNGFIRLVDNDDDDKYDVVFVWSFKTYVLDDVNTTERRLVAKSGDVFEIDSDDEKYVTVYVDGKRSDIDKLSAPLVFSYAESIGTGKPVRTFYVSTEYIKGTATSKSSSKNKITIDGTVYDLRSSVFNDVPLNVSCTFYIDSFGYVAYYETDKDAYKVGYLTECKIVNLYDGKERGFLRMFTTNVKFEEVILAEKVKYNGAAKDYGTKIVNDWLELADCSQLISYKLNEDGEICEINTALDAPMLTDEGEKARAENKFRKSYSGSSKFRTSNYTFELYVAVDNNTKVFFIPTDPTDEEDYRLVNRYSLSNDASYNFTAYNVDEFGTAEFIVVKKTWQSGSHGFHIADGVGTTLDSDGDTKNMVECWSGASKAQFVAAENSNFASINLKTGDIFRVYQNNAGEVATFSLLWRYAEGEYPDFVASTRSSDNLVAGVIKKLDRAGGKFIIEAGGEHMILTLPSSNAAVYDGGTCTTIPTTELCVGDHVVLKTSGATVSMVTVIK